MVMKKFFLLVIVFSFTVALHPLYGDDLSYTAFTLNYSYQDVHTDADYIKTVWSGEDDKLAHGFNLGIHLQQKLYKKLVLVTGVQYQFTARFKENVSMPDVPLKGQLSGSGDIKFFNHNIIVPIKFGFSMPFGGTSSFTVYGGPSLNFNVATHQTFELNSKNYLFYDYVNGRITEKINGSKHTDKSSDFKEMKWFDIPLGLGAVVKFGRFGLRFEYEWGLVNRMKHEGKFRSDQLTAGILISF